MSALHIIGAYVVGSDPLGRFLDQSGELAGDHSLDAVNGSVCGICIDGSKAGGKVAESPGHQGRRPFEDDPVATDLIFSSWSNAGRGHEI